MALLYNLSVSVGETKTFLVPNEAFNDFYKYITHSIFNIELDKIESHIASLNIPIEYPIMPQWEVFEKHLLSLFEQNFSSDIFVLIHIIDVIKPTNYFEIMTLYDEVKSKAGKLNIKTIFFLKKEDYVLSIPNFIHKIKASREFVILNEKGEYTISVSEKRNIPDFKSYFDNTKLTYEDRLKLKLIRKIGHFINEKDDRHISCQKYFYDGTYCKKEIIHLFYEQIVKEINENETFGVYIHCIPSLNN